MSSESDDESLEITSSESEEDSSKASNCTDNSPKKEIPSKPCNEKSKEDKTKDKENNIVLFR